MISTPQDLARLEKMHMMFTLGIATLAEIAIGEGDEDRLFNMLTDAGLMKIKLDDDSPLGNHYFECMGIIGHLANYDSYAAIIQSWSKRAEEKCVDFWGNGNDQ